MTDELAVLEAYVSAWNTSEADRRTRILAGCWGPEATYTDPTVDLCGAAALDDHIAGRRLARPDLVIEILGEVRLHHCWATFAWQVNSAGEIPVSGIDCVEFAPNGRLARVVGFFDSEGVAQ
ncbi:MAG TPA: hypothetical protein VHV82_03995 [Sporichthyaceae bacterium]|nr:hypothetical protein [Sporichthyaceae bacterium]